MLSERREGDQGRNHMYNDGRTEGPYEYVLPHVAECVQGRPLRQEDDFLERAVHFAENATCFTCSAVFLYTHSG